MESQRKNIKQFSGERYSVWKFRIRSLLSELGVLKVVDEPTPQIPDRKWLKSEQKAKACVIEYLCDSLLTCVDDESTAKDIFDKLDALYERKSLAVQLSIRKKLLNLKLQSDTTLISHFNVFDDFVCELISAGARLEEMDKVSHLLLTLPVAYDGVITAIETLSEDSLTLAFVKTRLLDHEIKIRGEQKDSSSKVLQTIVVHNKHKQMKRHYNKHFKARSNYKFNNKFNKQIQCHHCGKVGHIKKDCFRLKNLNQNKNNENKNNNQVNTAFAFMAGNECNLNNNNIKFLVDSGASDHIINNEKNMINVKTLNDPVKISVAKNGTFVMANKIGEVHISSSGNQIILKDVLLCEEIPHNLLSVTRMQAAGLTVTFGAEGVIVNKGNVNVLRGEFMGNMPFVLCTKLNVQSALQCNVENNKYDLWHKRLGHIGKSKFADIKKNNMFKDMELISSVVPSNQICEACINGKQSQLKYEKIKNKDHVLRPLFMVHTDVCGPISPSTINDENYYVVFIDQFTHYCVTYLIVRKSDVFEMFKDFVEKAEAHFNLKLVNLYCDNGREYLSSLMKSYCVSKGISYHLTIPYSPQLNGVAERMIRTITEKARAMLHGAGLEKTFWGEAVLTATYLINRTPSNVLTKHGKTPFELWHGKKPVLKFLRVFGSTIYRLNKLRTSKFQGKSLKGILVGYDPNGYKIWCLEEGKFVYSRDVVVDENIVESRARTVASKGLEDSCTESARCKAKAGILESPCTFSDKCKAKAGTVENPVVIESSGTVTENCNTKVGADEDPCTNGEICKAKAGVDCSVIKKPRLMVNESGMSQGEADENSSENEEKLRRSERIRKQAVVNYDENNYYDNCLMSAQIEIDNVPSCFSNIDQRSDRELWFKAIKEELESHENNGTWTFVKKPTDKNIVDSRWVFTIKSDEFGNPVRHKARLVARGFTQEFMIDYTDTFAPVARIASFRFMMAFANQYNLAIHHMDVKTAFLNGDLAEEIYMKPPEGLHCKPNYVCKLHKSIYGLKQAARCWYKKFENTLKQKGFKNSAVDQCIYFLDKGHISKNVYIVLYVDDLVIMTASKNSMIEIKDYLAAMFEMKDMGEIKFFVGIRIEKGDKTIRLSQSAYIDKILKKFGMQDCKPSNSPLPSKLDFDALNSDEQINAPCRNLIGCLMYLMLCTRPDLSASINILSRYSTKTNKELWQYLKRVLRYLKGTIDLKLEYKQNEYTDTLVSYVDSDWGGGDKTDRKSTTGFLFKMFNCCTICWSTRRQNSVAASSTEAEYMALFEAVREALWLKSLCNSISLELSLPIKIFEDNVGCISIAKNPTCHKRSKHIDIKFHFTREQVEHNVIAIDYISTERQLADALTKPLAAPRFIELRAEMGLK